MCKNVNIDRVCHKWCKGFGTPLAVLQLYHTVFFPLRMTTLSVQNLVLYCLSGICTVDLLCFSLPCFKP